jgi:hypothetical protein
MRDFITLGPTPTEEDCAQVGTSEYYDQARKECRRFIELLRTTFGPEPAGTLLRMKAFDHDFGTYHEVVCYYDTDIPESVDYAFRCEAETPKTWEG